MEAYLTLLFEDTNLAAIHAKSVANPPRFTGGVQIVRAVVGVGVICQ